jgi:FtsP/CotA-like multicopper oxidase with cupredoxin domain
MGLVRYIYLLAALVQTLVVSSYAVPLNQRGATKEFDFVVTYEPHAPDGFSRDMFLVNGQSPGPVIEVNQDDWVVVRVHNKSPYNTTVHFHG